MIKIKIIYLVFVKNNDNINCFLNINQKSII